MFVELLYFIAPYISKQINQCFLFYDLIYLSVDVLLKIWNYDEIVVICNYVIWNRKSLIEYYLAS